MITPGGLTGGPVSSVCVWALCDLGPPLPERI
jgi:hypothetical protein